MFDRIASDTPFIPSVAFGLKALTLAMKAKCNKLAAHEPDDLIAAAARLVPDDTAAAAAAVAFAQSVRTGSQAAGVALHDFVADWGQGGMAHTARRTEEALRDMAPAHFNWQTRKDCGHG